MYSSHISVLLAPVIELLDPEWQSSIRSLHPERPLRILDMTLGLGGHAEAIITQCLSPGDIYVGYDRDLDNLESARSLLDDVAREHRVILDLRHESYRDILRYPDEQFDAILGDFGVSSVHYDRSDLGFSIRSDGPLDMRFDRSDTSTTPTAREYLSRASKDELIKDFRLYGEEPKAPYIADAIIEARAHQEILTTFDLKEIISTSSYDPKSCIRVFQAIRITVNGELTELEETLKGIHIHMRPLARMGLISFHSLEDRIIKESIKPALETQTDPRTGQITIPAPLKKLHKKPIEPTQEEIANNPRSRSAQMRTYFAPLYERKYLSPQKK